MHMASMRESRDSDRFSNTHVQSHALLRRGFGTSVPFIAVSVGGAQSFTGVSLTSPTLYSELECLM